MKNRTITFTTTLLALGFLALASTIQALNPPPDGGYPGQNTAEGDGALDSLTFFHGQPSATENTALGFHALVNNTVGNENTAVGKNALLGNINGDSNTATGVSTLVFANGNYNTAIGKGALSIIGSGSFNAALGGEALSSSINGSFNTALGYSAGVGIGSANNVICIGANVAGDNVSNSCYIGSIFDQTAADGAQVFINSNDKLATRTSSKRFKEEIKPMDKTSEALFALKPVNFRYKKEIDPGGTSQFGLVAEDVEKVNADLILRDKEGKPYSVRYDAINAMLLNEFLKEHGKVQNQQEEISALKRELKEQRALIQQVSAQVELSKPSPRTALNDR
jgi:trimeric autotransporter adhesin